MLGKLFSGGETPLTAQVPLSFRVSAERSLRLSSEDGYETLDTWHHLSHHVRRYPHDLRAHIQRILLAQSDSLSDRLDGSLMDLFLALGNSGQMLKKRMLDLCDGHIQEETSVLLNDWLDNGLEAGQSAPWVNGSMLTTGESRVKHKLITQIRNESANNYTSILAEIQDCLEYGQIDIAQELLEKEILDGRGTPELEQELLTIYQHTRNKEGLESLTGAIKASGSELSQNWANALHEATNW